MSKAIAVDSDMKKYGITCTCIFFTKYRKTPTAATSVATQKHNMCMTIEQNMI